MRWIRILVSILLVVVIIMIGVLLIIGGSTQRFLHHSVYQEAFEDSGVYQTIDKISANRSMLGMGAYIKGDLRQIFDNSIVETLAYVRGAGEKPNISVEIDMQAIRSYIEEQGALFPVCNAGQQPYQGEEVVCKPLDKNISVFLDEVLEKKNVSLFQQNKIDLLSVYDPQGKIHVLRDNVRRYYLFFYAALCIELLLLLCMFFLWQTPSKRTALRLIGMSLILAGMIALALVIIGNNLLNERLVSLVASSSSSDDGGLEAIINLKSIGITLAHSLIGSFVATVKSVGAIVALVGLVIFGVSWAIKKPDA